MAAERLYANMCAIKRRAPPTEADQKEVYRTTIAAQVTRLLRPRDADMTEQAWKQRAREQLPATPNDYVAHSCSTISPNSFPHGMYFEKVKRGRQIPATPATSSS